MPAYGYQLPMNHVFPEKAKPFTIPQTFKVIRELLFPAICYVFWWIRQRAIGRKPYMDNFDLQPARQIYGAPIGGIGAGTIGRGFRGEFCRFSLIPGMYCYGRVLVDQFIVSIRSANGTTIYQKVLSCYRNRQRNGEPKRRCPKGSLRSWDWTFPAKDGRYTALYPRAWYDYDIPEHNLHLTCRQISPIIPHNYQDSCLPCAVFVWTVGWLDPSKCSGDRGDLDVSICFSFGSSIGHHKLDRNGTASVCLFQQQMQSKSTDDVCGFAINRQIRDMKCVFGVAAQRSKGIRVSALKSFNPQSDGADLWDKLFNQGQLDDCFGEAALGDAKAMPLPAASAVCASCVLSPLENKSHDLKFALSWDQPLIHFGGKGQFYKKRYTRWFNSLDGSSAAPNLCEYALQECSRWEREIDAWQQPILDCSSLPDWYKSALFNELYYVADGGTVWVDYEPPLAPSSVANGSPTMRAATNGDNHADAAETAEAAEVAQPTGTAANGNDVEATEPLLKSASSAPPAAAAWASEPGASARLAQLASQKFAHVDVDDLPDDVRDIGHFAYLEGHEYRMYNTYDVHHYASFALIMLWPRLQLALQYDYRRAIHGHNANSVRILNGLHRRWRKSPLCVPHDLGDPDEEPWRLVNVYHMHDTADWKDLNVKFVLQVLRDFVFTGDERYLRHMYDTCNQLMRDSLQRWDTDGDGIIDSGGFPDQTYDTWTMTGASAYTGGLWLCAVSAMLQMADALTAHRTDGSDGFDLPADRLATISDDRTFYEDVLQRGRVSLVQKLWNGQYFKYDSTRNSIMADQLCGYWFLRHCKLSEQRLVYTSDQVLTTLRTIFTSNVQPFRNGTMGAINGVLPDGRLDQSAVQSTEFWCGVTYGLAATMIMEGLVDEGLQTASGVYLHCYERLGLAFQVPESYRMDNDQCYRCLGYMRPLAIWAVQHALQLQRPQWFQFPISNMGLASPGLPGAAAAAAELPRTSNILQSSQSSQPQQSPQPLATTDVPPAS